MALTKKGTQYADPDGHPVVGMVAVDASGYALTQLSLNQSTPSLGTSYTAVSLAGNPMINATAPEAIKFVEPFHVLVHLSSVVTAATVTAKLTEDTAGDYPVWVGDAQTIEVGEVTSNRGSVSWSFSNVHFNNSQASFTLWLKLNAGTADVNSVLLTWRALT